MLTKICPLYIRNSTKELHHLGLVTDIFGELGLVCGINDCFTLETFSFSPYFLREPLFNECCIQKSAKF